jgi:hypothetical protein
VATIGIDVKRNILAVGMIPEGAGEARSELASLGASVQVEVAERIGLTDCTARADCHPPLRAGLDIWRATDSAHCTAGFVYQNASYILGGFRGKVLTTAGHCSPTTGGVGGVWRHGNPAENIGAVYMNLHSSGTEADVMFIDISDSWASNDVFKKWIVHPGSASIQDITVRGCAREISGSSCELVGEDVCFAGRTSSYQCGTLDAINITATGDDGIQRLHNRTVIPNESSGGDSGAPAFFSTKAKGHLWGGTSSAWYYSHIYYVEEACSYNTTCRLQTAN